MPIHYFIDLPCGPREELGGDDLLRLVDGRLRAHHLREQAAASGAPTDDAQIRFRERITQPSGEEVAQERTVADLMAETAVLEPLATQCRQCPARLAPAPFTCIGAISFPISGFAQSWLLERLPAENCRQLELFWTSVDTGWYGRSPTLPRWRRAGLVEGWESPQLDCAGRIATADMLLHQLFLVGDIMPAHALGILLQLGLLKASTGVHGDELLDLLSGLDEGASAEDAPALALDLNPEPTDDDSLREVKQFLWATFGALSLQVPLAIRL